MTVTPVLPLVAIYADESCLGNGQDGDNPGAAAGVIEYRSPGAGGVMRRDFWRSEPATTNNRMALWSVIEAFRTIANKGGRFRVLFTSDSQYLIKGMSEWVPGWIARGWRRKAGPIENLALWKDAVECVRPHQVQWQWVRGHDGHVQNEYANDLAVHAAREQTASGGSVPSGFDRWLGAERAAGRLHAEPAGFPHPDRFRASRPLPLAAQATLLD
ncbi:MAG: ribonuclease H [Gemmatimonadaceae bacterium]|nr:ribonuclease H [Gemmatimonadaceae bacterium]